MQSLELNDDHASILTSYLQHAVSELTAEIGATDGRDYREKLKTERHLLEDILKQLTSGADTKVRDEPP